MISKLADEDTAERFLLHMKICLAHSIDYDEWVLKRESQNLWRMHSYITPQGPYFEASDDGFVRIVDPPQDECAYESWNTSDINPVDSWEEIAPYEWEGLDWWPKRYSSPDRTLRRLQWGIRHLPADCEISSRTTASIHYSVQRQSTPAMMTSQNPSLH